MNELEGFFLSTNRELLATVNRLDELIGNRHWLSVGSYKETLLKKSLRNIVPKKYSIDSGFIIAANKNGDIIRSSQTDILIWDSTNYSPLFQDDGFVIIPPESCKIMIEVKGMLNRENIKKTIKNFDKIIDFRNIPFMQDYRIMKYLFAYDLDDIKFPEGIFSTINKAYTNCKYLSLEDRLKIMQIGWPQDFSTWPLYRINGIFILSKGFITCSEQILGDDNLKLLFHAFSINAIDRTNVYSLFETEIISLLGRYSGGRQGSWYEDQPGLLSLRRQLKIQPSSPKSLMVLPKTDKKYFYKNFNMEEVFDEL
jgi:hypothetical protein